MNCCRRSGENLFVVLAPHGLIHADPMVMSPDQANTRQKGRIAGHVRRSTTSRANDRSGRDWGKDEGIHTHGASSKPVAWFGSTNIDRLNENLSTFSIKLNRIARGETARSALGNS